MRGNRGMKNILVLFFTTFILAFTIGCANSDKYLINRLAAQDSIEFDTSSEENKSEKDEMEVNVVDIRDGSSIDTARFVIVDLNKEFSISKENNTITNIPYKDVSKASDYPYGYTTITYADGYYPKIDHNFKFTSRGGSKLTIELTPIDKADDKSFTEVFHISSDVEMVEFLNHYNLVQYGDYLKSRDVPDLTTRASEMDRGNSGLKVNAVNIKDGRSIDAARFIIIDLNKEFYIAEGNNIIAEVPYKEVLKAGYYPYRYTTITYADGYYPRIDHNLKLTSEGEGSELTIELTPIGEFDNSSFNEIFHESNESEMTEFLRYYNFTD